MEIVTIIMRKRMVIRLTVKRGLNVRCRAGGSILYRIPILTAYKMSNSREHACILLIPSVLSNWGQL